MNPSDPQKAEPPTPNAAQRKLLDRLIAAMADRGAASADVRALSQAVGAPPQAIEAMLALGAATGEIVWIKEKEPMALEGLVRLRNDLAQAFGQTPFSVVEVRDRWKTSRGEATKILEWMDAKDWTSRIEGKRVVQSP